MVDLSRERSTSMTVVIAPMTSSNIRRLEGGLANSGVTIAPERRGSPPCVREGYGTFRCRSPFQSQ
jgi:hypothetical protein